MGNGRELPIIFSPLMLRAILDGRKTQTRRVVTPQPNGIRFSPFSRTGVEDEHGRKLKPKYNAGDILWVKESFKIGAWNCINDPFTVAIDYLASPEITKTPWLKPNTTKDVDIVHKWVHESYDECLEKGLDFHVDKRPYEAGKCPTRIRPSIFMPKFVSRIWLKVTDVRIERLQNISREDAIAEGIYSETCPYTGAPMYFEMSGVWSSNPVHGFKSLWNSINGKDKSKSWEACPWVWVYEFDVINLKEGL